MTMADLFEPRGVVSVRFRGSDRTYDYFVSGENGPVTIGQLAVVPTKRGEQTVEIVGIKAETDEHRAMVEIVRLVPLN